MQRARPSPWLRVGIRALSSRHVSCNVGLSVRSRRSEHIGNVRDGDVTDTGDPLGACLGCKGRQEDVSGVHNAGGAKDAIVLAGGK